MFRNKEIQAEYLKHQQEKLKKAVLLIQSLFLAWSIILLFLALFGDHGNASADENMKDSVKLELLGCSFTIFVQCICTLATFCASLRYSSLVAAYQYVQLVTYTTSWFVFVILINKNKGFTVNFALPMNMFIVIVTYASAMVNTHHYALLVVIRDLWCLAMFSLNQFYRS